MTNDGTYEFGDPTVMWLRTSPDFTGQYDRNCGAADKTEALAPMYPQFVMRISNLRSS